MRFKETFKTKINQKKKNNEQTDQLGELVGRLRGPPGIPGRGRPGPPGLPGLQGVTGWQQMLFFAIETHPPNSKFSHETARRSGSLIFVSMCTALCFSS